jgi:hypothetical protein
MGTANVTRERRRAAGQCIECGVENGGNIRCEVCKRKNKESQERRAEKNKARGICRWCGQRPVIEGKNYCEECLPKANEATRKHAQSRRDRGLCLDCNNETGGKTSRCKACLARHNEETKTRRAAWQAEGKCRDCGKEAVLSNRSMRSDKDRSNYCRACYFKVLAVSMLGARQHWEVLVRKLDECGWRCPYTGEELVLGHNLSFDHIYPVSRFPERRHDVNNIEPITWKINMLKRDLTKDEFITLVRNIASYVK